MEVKCSFCGKKFRKKPSAVGERNYCSRRCYGKHKKITSKGKNNSFYGKHHTEETKKKISKANTGKKHGKAWNSDLSNYDGKLDRVTINGKRMLKSHYIWLKNNEEYDEIPKGYVVHHKDENPHNNKISNLKLMEDTKHKKLHIRLLKKKAKMNLK